ncbi:MAG: GTPase HflX, partial [Eubacterium sp.]
MALGLVNEEKKERALLIAVDTGEYDAEVSIQELEELAKTAGAQTVGQMIQKRDTADGATFVGKGRLEEISGFCRNNDVDLII